MFVKSAKRLLPAIVVAWAALVGVSHAATLSVSPSSQTVAMGANVFVDINVAGLGAAGAPSVGAYDLNVSYDSLLLTFVSATFGHELDIFLLGSNPSGVSTALPNTVNVFEVSLDSVANLNNLQSADFTLFRLTFTGAALGTSPIGISVNALADSAGDTLARSVVGGNVTVAAVPAPAAGWLLVTGVAGVVGQFRRRQSVLKRRRLRHITLACR